MACNILKDNKKCGKDAIYHRSLWDIYRGVWVATETCIECEKRIREGDNYKEEGVT